jgi:acyl-CoA thioesterase FadM
MQDRERSYAVELRERDIDVFGHVHYAEYLVFCAQARNWWLADAGIEHPGDHVVARVEVDFLASARLADGRVHVGILVEEVGRSSARLLETIRSASGAELVRVRSVVVRYDPADRRPVPWTAAEGRALQPRPSRDSGS